MKFQGSPQNAWNQKEVPSWQLKMKILEITLQNCKTF